MGACFFISCLPPTQHSLCFIVLFVLSATKSQTPSQCNEYHQNSINFCKHTCTCLARLWPWHPHILKMRWALLGAWYLVPHVMLLECVAVFEDLQAIWAEQMPSVLVDHPEMDVYLRVERGAILTHLGHRGGDISSERSPRLRPRTRGSNKKVKR